MIMLCNLVKWCFRYVPVFQHERKHDKKGGNLWLKYWKVLLPAHYILVWAVKMLFFWLPKVNKLASTKGILGTRGFYKLPGLPQRSQIWINSWHTSSILKDFKDFFEWGFFPDISILQISFVWNAMDGCKSQVQEAMSCHVWLTPLIKIRVQFQFRHFRLKCKIPRSMAINFPNWLFCRQGIPLN